MPKTMFTTILFTVAVAFVALIPATEVGAACAVTENTADFECNDGNQGNYTVRIVQPFAEVSPCASDPSQSCTNYRWNITPAGSHFNLIIEQPFGALVEASTGGALDCSGDGDPSQGADGFAKYLQWNCFMKFQGTGIHSLTLKGEFTSEPTDWFVKQASDPAQGDFGITRGPAELGGITRSSFQPVQEAQQVQFGERKICFQVDGDSCPTIPVFCADDPVCLAGSIPMSNDGTCPIDPVADLKVVVDGAEHSFVDCNTFEQAGVCPNICGVAASGSTCQYISIGGAPYGPICF
jgi:hypothetical protein